MKIRIFAFLLCLLLALTSFASCSSSQSTTDSTDTKDTQGTASSETDATQVTEIDIDALALDLSKVSFVEPVELLDSAVVEMLYGFTAGASKVVVYAGSGATPEEIIVAEYANEPETIEAFAKYETYLANQKVRFDDYNVEFRPLLNTTVLSRIAGKYIVYCVCNDSAAAQTAVNSHLTVG